MDYQLDDEERTVLDVIRHEGRVNPLRVRDQTGLRKQYVNDALRQLVKLGVIQKVNRGLYEHVPDEDDLLGADQDDEVERTPEDARIQTLEERNEDLRSQLEAARSQDDVDRECLREAHAALDRALAELPESAPGRTAVEDAHRRLWKVIDGD
ncbi:hypothetical protein [Halorussus marinus]|uniref:hypothetical protein n=1 Tax=Halorussus marinus TaxID=2505976 RepID=UPI001ADD61A3|nr:hypothetical protein [Halorussus marinus]